MIGKFIAGLICMCFIALNPAISQSLDTAFVQRDTISPVVQKPAIQKDSARLALEALPRRAAIRSAILPGLGQITNRRWWKVPLVYGGYVGLGLVFEFNNRYYKIFLEEAQYREQNNGKAKNPNWEGYTTEGIISIKDSYRRNRDLTILAGLGFHAVQIIDAYVDAKFFRFDISDELSIRMLPSINPVNSVYASQNTPSAGFKIILSL